MSFEGVPPPQPSPASGGGRENTGLPGLLLRFASFAAPVTARLPAFPPSALLAAALNMVFSRPEQLEALYGKRVAIRVDDAGLRFQFTVTPGGFVALREAGWPAVTISAAARDFLDVALRRADPDTLFFARRLVIEGDTELGLMLKNRLDALENPGLPARPPRPGALARALATALGLPWPGRGSRDASGESRHF